MASSSTVRVLGLCGLAVLVAACDTLPVRDARARLDAHIEDCSRRHDYHPDQAAAGEQGLAPGEPAFLECVYAGVERLVVPHTAVPGDYRRLVARHRLWSAAVAAGDMTRGERRARTEAMLEAIEARELAAEVERQQRLADLQQRMMEEQRQLELEEHIRRMHQSPIERALLGR